MPTGNHGAPSRRRQLQNGAAHHFEGAILQLQRVGIEDLGVHGETGVVDEQVDGAVRVLQTLRHRGHGVPVGEVGLDRLHAHAVAGLDLLLDLRHPSGVPGDDDDVVAP